MKSFNIYLIYLSPQKKKKPSMQMWTYCRKMWMKTCIWKACHTRYNIYKMYTSRNVCFSCNWFFVFVFCNFLKNYKMIKDFDEAKQQRNIVIQNKYRLICTSLSSFYPELIKTQIILNLKICSRISRCETGGLRAGWVTCRPCPPQRRKGKNVTKCHMTAMWRGEFETRGVSHN